MVYEYSNRSYPVPAQAAGEYLEEISKRENGVTAERLLELSRDENALLHKCFTWDNTKAAEKYRLYESRQFIGNIVVVKVDDKPVPKQRAYVSVTETAHGERGVFKPLVTALTDKDSRQIVLKNALRDMVLFKNKYSGLKELTRVFDAMDLTLSEVD